MADVRNPISILNINDTSYNIKDVRRPYLVLGGKSWISGETGTYTYTVPQRGIIIYTADIHKTAGTATSGGYCKFYRSRSSVTKLDTAVDESLVLTAGSSTAMNGVASGALCVAASDVISVQISSPNASTITGYYSVYFMPFS